MRLLPVVRLSLIKNLVLEKEADLEVRQEIERENPGGTEVTDSYRVIKVSFISILDYGSQSILLCSK